MEKIVLSDELARKLYRHRCVVCRMMAYQVHEIIPRSQMKDWDVWDNRVVLCASHHQLAHAMGALRYKPFLEEKRAGVLEAYYGRDYQERIAGILNDL